MGAAKKSYQYKKYTVEKDNATDNATDKKHIDLYVEKIQKQLENDTQLQKKAAALIEIMINSTPQNK